MLDPLNPLSEINPFSRAVVHLTMYFKAESTAQELATGTGFPKVFYLNYHLYRLYFPLLALAEFARILKSPSTER